MEIMKQSISKEGVFPSGARFSLHVNYARWDIVADQESTHRTSSRQVAGEHDVMKSFCPPGAHRVNATPIRTLTDQIITDLVGGKHDQHRSGRVVPRAGKEADIPVGRQNGDKRDE